MLQGWVVDFFPHTHLLSFLLEFQLSGKAIQLQTSMLKSVHKPQICYLSSRPRFSWGCIHILSFSTAHLWTPKAETSVSFPFSVLSLCLCWRHNFIPAALQRCVDVFLKREGCGSENSWATQASNGKASISKSQYSDFCKCRNLSKI